MAKTMPFRCRKCGGVRMSIAEVPRIGVWILPKGEVCGHCRWRWMQAAGR